VILGGAMLVMFMLAGVAEWTDLSFKSERQVSRYLNIPVIGVIPDLDPLFRRLQLKKPSY
jgi:capsular polysaccharide biosynthesis protein